MDPRHAVRDVLTVAGALSVLIGAFMLGRQTHPEEGCCSKLVRRDLDELVQRERMEPLIARGMVVAVPAVAMGFQPMPTPTDPWPTHPWDRAGASDGVPYNVS